MATRIYLASIVGTGSDDDPYRAKLPPGTDHVAVITSGADGHPQMPWCLVMVARSRSDWSDLDDDPDLDRWPTVSLGTRGRDLPDSDQQSLAAALSRRGLAADDVGTDSTLREILLRVGRSLDASFDDRRFAINV